MKRTVTISMTLALVLVSALTSLATATNVNVDSEKLQKLTIVYGGDGDCKGDDKDPCEPPRSRP